MRKPMAGRLGCLAGLVVLVLATGGCFYFVGDTSRVAPRPADVRIQRPPTINSCEAEFIVTNQRDHYEQVCGWCWNPCCRPCPGGCCGCYYWCCRTVWRWKDVTGDIVLRLTVSDPSDDLDLAKSPRVRVLDSRPAEGADQGCLLPLRSTDIVLVATDITGEGAVKTVQVRLRGVGLRFTGDCPAFAARIPLRIVFIDCGREMLSTNGCEAVLLVRRP